MCGQATYTQPTQQTPAQVAADIVGVRWVPNRKKFRAEIRLNGRKQHLGYFSDAGKASEAYNNAAKLRDSKSTTASTTVDTGVSSQGLTNLSPIGYDSGMDNNVPEAPWDTNTENLSLVSLVERVITTKVNNLESFSAHDITVAARELVNTGQVYIPGVGVSVETLTDGSRLRTQAIVHNDVRQIVRDTLTDTQLATIGYQSSMGIYVLYEPITVAPAQVDSVAVNVTVDDDSLKAQDMGAIRTTDVAQDTQPTKPPLIVRMLTLGLYKGRRN